MDKEMTSSAKVWLLVATVPPILSVVHANSWVEILLIGILCVIVCVQNAPTNIPKWLCVMELLWLIIYAGAISRESGIWWDDEHSIVPLIVLLMAAYTAQAGIVRPARIGSVLVWLVLPVLLLVALAGAADVQWNWLTVKADMPSGLLGSLLLVPCVTKFLVQAEGQGKKWLPVTITLTAMIATLLLNGTVGDGKDFYEFSKGITLFGVAERFEALVGCVMTMGWFVLLSVIFSAVFYLSEIILPGAAKKIVWVCAGGSMLCMWILPKGDGWLLIGTLIFWGLLPLLTQGLVGTKKVEKK